MSKNAEIPEQTVTFSMPVDGRTVKTVIKAFCQKPYRDDDSFEHCSIGVARNSIVATDGRSAILFGQPASFHFATQRKEALLEGDRAHYYGEPARIDLIPKNLDESGKARVMVDVQGVLKERLSGMSPVASFSPEALAAIGKTALAAGAVAVELLIPTDDSNALGFKFEAPIRDEFMDLFSEYDGHTIKAQGIFAVRRSEPRQTTTEDIPEPSGKAPRKASSKRTALQVVVNDALPEREPLVNPIDVNALESEASFVDINEERTSGGMALPPISVLHTEIQAEHQTTGEHASAIVQVLRSFNINATIERFLRGPVITQYQVEIPHNIKTGRVVELADNLQMSLAVNSVRIEAPIPGVNAIGIEVPNAERSKVFLRDLVSRTQFWSGSPLTFAIGLDVSGRPHFGDLATMPHLLIAGATNSGKSIGLSTLISSLLMRNAPSQLRLVMIDPKRVELTLFDQIPHLLCPVIKDVKEAPGVLRALWREMDRRYDLLSEVGVRNIEGYNEKAAVTDRLPYIAIIIDELADLMIQARAEVETSIMRLTQLARAVGIHMVIATQRPSVDVITGTIKANVPSRIAYATASGIDSKTILDTVGAEKLLGRGDMLYYPIGANKPIRLQGVYMSEEEIADICSYWRGLAPPNYAFVPEVLTPESSDAEPLMRDVVEFVVEKGSISTSMIQRKYRLGFQRASNIIADLLKFEIIDKGKGSAHKCRFDNLEDVLDHLEAQ